MKKKGFLALLVSTIMFLTLPAYAPSLTVAKESRAHKRRNYAIYELLLSF